MARRNDRKRTGAATKRPPQRGPVKAWRPAIVALCLLLSAALTACGGGAAVDTTGAADANAAVGSGAGITESGSGGESTADGGAASTGTTGTGSGGGPTGSVSGALTISSYDTMRYKTSLESAARLFEAKYPETTVSVETFSAMPEVKRSESADGSTIAMSVTGQDDPQGRADYVNKINTALMSGEGADILAADVLPIAKYVESGLVEDLAPYMEADPDFDRADYRENILDAVSWNGGTWFLPLDYSFNYYTYDSTLIPSDAAAFGPDAAFTTERLMEIGIPLYDGATKLLNTADYSKGADGSTWARLLREHWSEFVDVTNKAAHFTDGGFAELLNTAKRYGAEGYVPAGVTGQRDAGPIAMGSGPKTPTDRYAFKSKNQMNLFTYILQNSNRGVNMQFGGGAAGIETDDEIAGIAANANGEVPFTYSQAYLINSNSKNKEAAWAFLKFMASGEMQALGGAGGGMRAGLPLHNETRARYIELMLESMSAERGIANAAFSGGAANAGTGAEDGAESASAATAADTASADAANQTDAADTANPAAGGGAGGAGNPAGGGPPADTANGGRRMAAAPELSSIDPALIDYFYETTEQFSDQINTFEIKDTTVDDMIAAEVVYFFEGTKSAEDVARALQSKVELYLNE
jgi:ABC-type glycerol-3-phosphate transport system substrate-binding protein